MYVLEFFPFLIGYHRGMKGRINRVIMGIREKKVQVFSRDRLSFCFPRVRSRFVSCIYIYALVARVLIKARMCNSPIYVERLVKSGAA